MMARRQLGVKTRPFRLPIGTHELGLRREAPQLGEHTLEILSQAGIGEERLADLDERRVVVVRGADALA